MDFLQAEGNIVADSQEVVKDLHGYNQDIVEDSERLQSSQKGSSQIDYGLLIEAIQGFSYLYDLSHKLYKDSKKKTQAWEQISELLNCSVDDCMKAWKNIRDRFVKEKNKLTSGSEAPETNWSYYNSMPFYSKFTKPRKTYTTTIKVDSQPPSSASRLSLTSRPSSVSRPSSSKSVWHNITMKTLTSEDNGTKTTAPSDAEVGEESGKVKTPQMENQSILQTPLRVEKEANETSTTSSAPSRKRKRKTIEENDPQMEDLVNMASTIVTRFDSRPLLPRNVNTSFMEYVSYELEKMPEDEAKKKRRQILNNIFSD